MKSNIQWKKALYGIILIVIGIILAAIHFIVDGNGIGDFISGIIAVISVLVMLVGTYITSSGIKNCKLKILKCCECYAGWYMILGIYEMYFLSFERMRRGAYMEGYLCVCKVKGRTEMMDVRMSNLL